jgi:hypothetical protein
LIYSHHFAEKGNPLNRFPENTHDVVIRQFVMPNNNIPKSLHKVAMDQYMTGGFLHTEAEGVRI